MMHSAYAGADLCLRTTDSTVPIDGERGKSCLSSYLLLDVYIKNKQTWKQNQIHAGIPR